MVEDSGSEKLDRIVSEARQAREERDKGYREQALKMYPWVCGRCAREFTRHNLSQLTVHHRDHNHDNNPADGSNWELLCLYCHDNEHSRYIEAEQGYSSTSVSTSTSTDAGKSAATHHPFANLGEMMKNQKKDSGNE